MKKMVLSLSLVSLILIIACKSGSSEKEEPSIAIPGSRELDPYSLDTLHPVNAGNLYEAVKEWKSAWNGKEVAVILWTGGGLSVGPTLRLTDPENPGVTVFNATLLEGEREKIRDYVTNSQMVVLTGKLRNIERMKYELIDCEVTGSFEGLMVKGARLDPSEDLTLVPVHPSDIKSSIGAWENVEVVVIDHSTVPVKGSNAISFLKEEGKKSSAGLFSDHYIRATLKKSLTDNKRAGSGVIRLKGKVDRMMEQDFLRMDECELMD